MVFSIFAAMKLGLIAPVVPFPSNKKLEKAILGHFHALSSNQASKPVWIWPSGLQTFLRSRVDSLLSLLPNESIACFNTIRCCTSNNLEKRDQGSTAPMPKEACKLHNLRTPHFSANKSEMASIPNDNPMKNSRHHMKAQPMPTSLINTAHNWPST